MMDKHEKSAMSHPLLLALCEGAEKIRSGYTDEQDNNSCPVLLGWQPSLCFGSPQGNTVEATCEIKVNFKSRK
jgi:hypothetical protein